MAKRLKQPATFDDLPFDIRSEALDMLLAGDATRKVADFIGKRGYGVSHMTLARYKRDKIAPAILTSEKALAIQQLANMNVLGTESVTDVTKQQLSADPLISRLERKYERYDTLTGQAVQAKDFAGFASIDRAETQAMRLHAELTGRLEQKQTNLSVQLVFANAVEAPTDARTLDTPDVIDIQPVRQR